MRPPLARTRPGLAPLGFSGRMEVPLTRPAHGYSEVWGVLRGEWKIGAWSAGAAGGLGGLFSSVLVFLDL